MSGKIEKDCFCQYCGKRFSTINGKNGHEPYCKQNPNRKDAWNKGLTKETNAIVAKYTESTKRTKKGRKYTAWNKGLTKSENKSVAQYGKHGSETKSKAEWKKQHLERVYQKYGGKHFTQTDEYKQNMIKVYLDKYGVSNPAQVPEIYAKIIRGRYKMKNYKFPSGTVVKLQGYEPYAVDKLLSDGYEESDIKVGLDVPRIPYKTDDNKSHVYHPDIFIPSENLLIEVKSVYTLMDNKNKNILKQRASLALGYKHEIWLIHNKQVIEKIVDIVRKYEDLNNDKY